MNFIAHRHLLDAASDPTGTHDIVARFGRDMLKRWRRAETIVTEQIEKNELLTHPGVGSYGLLTFQKFLDETLRHSIVEDGSWMAPYVADAIGRAESRARTILVRDADASAVDWQSILVTTALAELQGVAEAASQQAMRAVSAGLIAHQRPAKISRDVVSVLKNIGERRSALVADYIVIKAFAAATLETFRAQGVTHVGTQAEMVKATPVRDAARKTPQKRHGKTGRFTKYAEEPSGYLQRKARRAYKQLQEVPEVDVETAGDDRVCVKCENISEMGPYEIDTALSLIPAHSACRCIFVPAGTLDDVADAFDPNEPRVPGGTGSEGGRWTAEGIADPAVIKVGGDEWNRQTAIRLEREYEAVKPELEKLAEDSVGEETASVAANSWDSLSPNQQQQAEDAWKQNSYDSYYESEIENWHENGDAKNDALTSVALNEDGWLADALKENAASEDATHMPFTPEQLAAAIRIDVQEGKVSVEIDDSKLTNPEGYDPNQMALPGFEPQTPASLLTKEMRLELITSVRTEVKVRAKDEEDKMEPPDYLSESTNDALAMTWEDMDDQEKFTAASQHLDLKEEGNAVELDALPQHFDPLQDKHASPDDYRRTQALANVMSVKRAEEILKGRGLPADAVEVEDADKLMWRQWKDSSTSMGGKVLQIAIAEELGGRLRVSHFKSNDVDTNGIKKTAGSLFPAIGGFDGVKALVRAKWETTQYLLDKADKPMLDVYRTVQIDETHNEPENLVTAAKSGAIYKQLPQIAIERNGAASTTIDEGVANGWDGSGRIVLRAKVPRTSVVSVPAYGINVHKEREVVIAGTSWVGWDAWRNEAPTFDEVPLHAN